MADSGDAEFVPPVVRKAMDKDAKRENPGGKPYTPLKTKTTTVRDGELVEVTQVGQEAEVVKPLKPVTVQFLRNQKDLRQPVLLLRRQKRRLEVSLASLNPLRSQYHF